MSIARSDHRSRPLLMSHWPVTVARESTLNFLKAMDASNASQIYVQLAWEMTKDYEVWA